MIGFSRAAARDNAAADSLKEHIGRQLKTARQIAGITQVDLAKQLGMHQSAVARIERQADIRFSTLRHIITILECTLNIDGQGMVSLTPIRCGNADLPRTEL